MVSWKTTQSLLIFFGPILLPKAIQYYRSIQNRPKSQLRPLPDKTSYALLILFISGLVAFASTLPIFAPSNIFRQTQSRLHTATGVLLSRLSALRPLTPEDEKLRKIFDEGGLDARLLYVRFGPSVLIDCPFSKPGRIEAGRDYLFYAAPGILAPHFLHLFALGIATSGFLSGSEGARWRTLSIIAGMVLAVAEFLLIANYDDRTNIASTRLSEIDFIHWKMAVYRGLAIATVDGILGWAIWLQATGRAFLAPTPVGERLMEHGKVMENVLGKVRGLGLVRNGVVRDSGLRRRVEGYWVKEGEVMKDVFEEREVLDAQRRALGRVDVERLRREADTYLDALLNGVPVGPGQVT